MSMSDTGWVPPNNPFVRQQQQAQTSPFVMRLPEPGDPILLNQPRVLKSFSRKVTGIYPQLATVDPTVARSLYELDRQRIAKGQSPLSDQQTVNAFQAAIPTADQPYGRTIQPEQERGTGITDLPANAIANLRDLFTSIPKLPFLAYQTVKGIPSIPSKLSEVAASGDLTQLQDVPVVNLVPGVYAASNLLSGNTDELMRNPLFTALDVLPYAKAKAFKAPASMLDETGKLARPNKAFNPVPDFRPDLLKISKETRRVAADGTPLVSVTDLAANTRVGRRVGGVKASATEMARESRVGQYLTPKFSDTARQVGIFAHGRNRLLADSLNPEGLIWQGEGSALLNGILDEDLPGVKALNEIETKYNDEFGKQNYGKPEAWAARRAEIANIVEGVPQADGQLLGMDTLTDIERQFVDEYKSAVDTIIDPYVSKDVNRPNVYLEIDWELVDKDGGSRVVQEIHPFEEGKRILKARGEKAAVSELRAINDIIANRKPIPAEELLARVQLSPVMNGKFSKDLKSAVMEGYVHAAYAAGIDANAFLSNAKKFRYQSVDAPFISMMDDLTKAVPNPVIPIDDIKAALRDVRVTANGATRRRPIYEPLRALEELIEGKANLTRVRNEFLRIFPKLVDDPNAPAAFKALNPDQVVQSLDFMKRYDKWQKTDIVKYSSQEWALKQINKNLKRIEDKAAPARFVPHLETIIRDRLKAVAEDLSDTTKLPDERAAKLVDMIYKGQYTYLDDLAGTPGFAKKTYNEILKDVPGMWRELAAEGFDPVFVHHVATGKTGKVMYPRVTPTGSVPSSFKKRGFDFRPREGDMALAARHQMLEILAKKLEDNMVDILVKGSPDEGINAIVRPMSDLYRDYEAPVDRAVAAEPGINRKTAADNLIGKTWVPFDVSKWKNLPAGREAMYPGGGKGRPGKKVSAGRALDQLMIPKAVNDLLEEMAKPMSTSMVWDPVMNTFRASTLLLSIRWQIYNVLGGALMITSSEGLGWVPQLGKSYKIVKALRKGENIPDVAGIPYNVRSTLAQGAEEQLAYQQAGREGVASLKDVARRTAPDAMAYAEKWGKPIGEGVNKALDFSVRMNAMVDDVLRISGFLSAEGKAAKLIDPEMVKRLKDDGLFQTRKGAVNSVAAKNQMAETMVRRWSYNWDQLTPWERGVARQIFPFYGFFSHILRYAGRYTMDHPFRVAVTAAFARNELKDWGTGVPQRVHNMLMVGSMDDKGEQKAINFAGWNPFADTASLFTLTGWMSQVNPIISTLLEQAGIDPRTGEASLYPNAEFDPTTGRLVLKKRGIVQSAIQNVVPQSQIAFNLSGQNPEFNELARVNRSAANRLIATAAGVPVLVRPINIPQEVAKTELTRENAARQALSQALKTSSTGPVSKYPALQQQVEALLVQRRQAPELFSQYTPQDAQPSTYDLVAGALTPWKSQ